MSGLNGRSGGSGSVSDGAQPASQTIVSGQAAPDDRIRLTNVGPPSVRRRLVPRQRLIDTLNGVLEYPIALVAAPAGFGKTTALVTWERQIQDHLAVAWLSLAPSHNDAVRFWSEVIAALRTQQPAVGAGALARLRAGASIDVAVEALVDDLAVLGSPLALVLDDYHLLDAPEIHHSLTGLVSQCPPAFHLVLSTRADPPLPLARLRSNGQLLELRAADLQFSEYEAAGLLGSMVGFDLAPAQVAALGARAEGWAAGLHLAALSLRSQTDVDAALTAFGGSDRNVVDYFVEEVLSRLPDRTRVFLERTSILDRMSAALCDAVVGEPGSAALLEALERANAFITPLDGRQQWYRYHHLFADALRHRLHRHEPELIRELHARASAWYGASGLHEPALEHALAAEQWDRAAALLGRLFLPLLRRGEEGTISRWLRAVPDEVCQAHPGLSRFQAAVLLTSGDYQRLEAFLTLAEPTLERAGEDDALGRLLAVHAQLTAVRLDLPGTLAHAQRALKLLPEDATHHRALALGALVQWHLMRGDPGSAGRLLEPLRASTTAEMEILTWSQHRYGAWRRHQAGDLQRAAEAYSAVIDAIGERVMGARQQAWLGLTAIALERNRLDEADSHVERIVTLKRLGAWTYQPIEPQTLLVRARVSRARGRLAAAADELDQAEAEARKLSSTRTLRLARAERAWIDLAGGHLADAARWADALDSTGLDEYAREPEALTLARLRRAQGAGAELAPLLERLLASAEELGRTDSIIAMLVQLALACEQQGESERGLEALQRAVTLAEPGGYVRTFLDEGEPLLSLLRRLLGRGVSAAYVGRILHLDGDRDGAASPLSGLLTPREREVLGLLALGLSNRAIAERLVTSESTVKSHVHRLIGKLGVASRAQVLIRARELGALEPPIISA